LNEKSDYLSKQKTRLEKFLADNSAELKKKNKGFLVKFIIKLVDFVEGEVEILREELVTVIGKIKYNLEKEKNLGEDLKNFEKITTKLNWAVSMYEPSAEVKMDREGNFRYGKENLFRDIDIIVGFLKSFRIRNPLVLGSSFGGLSWLHWGLFVLGFVFCFGLGLVVGRKTEKQTNKRRSN